MTTAQLREQYEALRDKISPLPWEREYEGQAVHSVRAADGLRVCCNEDYYPSEVDADDQRYIALSATAMPQLLAEVERHGHVVEGLCESLSMLAHEHEELQAQLATVTAERDRLAFACRFAKSQLLERQQTVGGCLYIAKTIDLLDAALTQEPTNG